MHFASMTHAVFAVALLLSPPVEVFQARVVAVADGDTITVLRAGREEKIRLEGIDCPELKQDFGRRAKTFTSEHVFDRTVRVEGLERDRYGRLIARVFADGADVNLALVRAGLAWHYKRYSDDEQLAEAEEAARQAKRGLWVQPAVAPWDWRRGVRLSGPEPTPPPDGCEIKGNISGKGERIYHTKESPAYSRTKIDLSKGERWFCSVADAEAAGWRAPKR